MTDATARVALIVGVGPGVGASLARALAGEGWTLALIARDRERLTAFGEQLQADGVTVGWTACDVADDVELTAAVTRFGAFADRLDLVHFNAVAFRPTPASQLSAPDLLADLAVGAAGLATVVQAALPFLRTGSRVLATGGGAADSPMSAAASLGVQKAALRNLVQALDADLRSRGVRAASLTVNGTIAPDTPFAPDAIAARLVELAAMDGSDWRSVVAYDG